MLNKQGDILPFAIFYISGFFQAFITFFTLFLQHYQKDWINLIMYFSLPVLHLFEVKKWCDPFSQPSDLSLALEVNKNWVNLWKCCYYFASFIPHFLQHSWCVYCGQGILSILKYYNLLKTIFCCILHAS